MRGQATATGIVVALLLTGCFGARPQLTRSFALAPPVVTPVAAAFDAPSVRVRDLEPSPIVDRDMLVVRRSAVEYELRDEYHWALRPHRMVASLLAHHLVDAGVVAAAPRTLGDGHPRFELAGRLDTMEHDRSGGKSVVRLAVVLRLQRFEDGAIVWRYRFSAEQKTADVEGSDGAAAAVAGLSTLVARMTTQASAVLQASGALKPAAKAMPDAAIDAQP